MDVYIVNMQGEDSLVFLLTELQKLNKWNYYMLS